jgi:threonine dehydrogenase-like Zn-dependent dehydrogenase/predicted dehydrogenase
MRQLFLDRGALAIKEVCQPALDDHSVLVSVSYSFMSSGSGIAKIINDRQHSILNKIPNKVKKIAELVSGKGLNYTSLMIKDRLAGRVFNLGHSCSGVVIAVGPKVHSFRVGDFVACAGTDFANHADVVCVPQHLVVRVRKEEDVRAASLTGIGAIALHSIERANLQLGQTIAVFGLEAVGQITMKLCQAAGCNVIGIDSDPELLKKAQAAGAQSVYDISRDNVAQIVDVLTDYAGIDCAILTPDFELKKPITEIVSIVKRKGRIVVTSNDEVDLPTEDACRKEIDLAFVSPYGPGLYHADTRMQSYEQKAMTTFVDLIATKKLDVSTFTKAEYALTEVSSALYLVQNKKELGVIIDFKSHGKLKSNFDLLQENASKISFVPARRGDPLKIGVMGASRSVRLNLMPILSKMEDSTINTIVDVDVSRSMTAARVYTGAKALSGNLSMFYNDDSDVVFISEIADIDVGDVITLLRQGKAVFAERPFIDSNEKLEKLEKFLQQNPDSQLCIGYSRRHSLFIKKIKKQLDKRNSPFIMHYRVNLGEITKEQRFAGAWRFGGIMAHASHILDMFYYLSGSKPLSVSVESTRTQGDNLFSADNFTAIINFADGSVCSLLFTTLGNPEMGKERMELFFDSKTIVMSDYKNLTGYGVAPYFDEKDKEPDLGMDQMVKEFFDGVRQGKNLFKVDELLMSTKLMLTVDKMVY